LLSSSDDDEEEESLESVEENDVAEPAEPSTTSDNPYDNAYVKRLLDIADLHILQPGEVNLAYGSSSKQLGLFRLFSTSNYVETVCKWTNESLQQKGQKSRSMKEFQAYMGLELGMSLLKYNDIKQYWAEGCFLGHEIIRGTMSRTRFQQIRASVCLQSYDGQTAANDPLWSRRSLLEQFIWKSASIAVPVGVSALDENSCPTKA
jgi:hypothetical protein